MPTCFKFNHNGQLKLSLRFAVWARTIGCVPLSSNSPQPLYAHAPAPTIPSGGGRSDETWESTLRTMDAWNALSSLVCGLSNKSTGRGHLNAASAPSLILVPEIRRVTPWLTLGTMELDIGQSGGRKQEGGSYVVER
jgi:hypothetical protein